MISKLIKKTLDQVFWGDGVISKQSKQIPEETEDKQKLYAFSMKPLHKNNN